MTWLRRLLATYATAAALALSAPAGAQGSPKIAPERQVLVMVRHPPEHFRPNGAYGGSYGDDLTKSARERFARSIARQHGLTFVDGWPMPMIGVDCFIMAVPEGRSTAAAADELSHDAKVAWAEPVQLYQAQGAAAPDNDPLYPAQPAARQWDLADLHRLATGRGIKVAVIDSGIEANHPDLAGQLLVNRNFVVGQSEIAESHGTGVAGVIAAKSDNGIGIAGVAPGARLLGLRACWQQHGARASTVCDGLSLAKALYFAVQEKADVINLSLSGPDDRLLRVLVDTALSRGSVVVGAYDAAKPRGGFPASVPGVIAVADRSFAAATPQVYIAPGRDVPTTQPGGRWFLVDGSSFSAAHVFERRMVDEFAALTPEVDTAWARLKQRIDPPRRAARRESWWDKVARDAADLWQTLTRPAVAALATAQLAIIAVVSTLASLSQPAYQTLGSAPRSQAPNVIAMFRADTTESQLRSLLQANGASLVGGPTSADAYLLQVPAQSRPAVLARLKADRHVVMAQPIDGARS